MGPAAQRELQLRLERLCSLLGVSAGRIAYMDQGKYQAVAQIGWQHAEITVLEARVCQQSGPLVISSHGEGIGFYAGMVMQGATEDETLVLSLFDNQARKTAVAGQLAAIANEVLQSAMLRRQQELIAKQKAIIADFQALEEQRRSLFDRASATAKVGIWQFNLVDANLFWTDGVYDIFELPRKMPLTRELVLQYYQPDSLRAMESVRAEAIGRCSDFSIDIEIVTAKGNQRWVRLTGAVESRNNVAHRIFGMKQDITAEKLLADRTRYLAEFDVMTGLANRGQFQMHLDALESSQIGGLLLVDLDGFKQINDTYGHAVGDACLKEAANRLRNYCNGAVLVSRIGGDEFAVLTKASQTQEEVAALATGIVRAISEPVNCLGHALTLGASIGVAYAGSGTPDDLFRHADTALYAAKAAGRNTSRTYQPAA
jgi:diguanylate cyclase (GGDEF)-like protein